MVIDHDLLGEPGWDILLYAFIAQRKGVACTISDTAAQVGVGLETARRWVALLEERGLLVRRDDVFGISDEAETKMANLFQVQIKEVLDEIAAYQRLTGEGGQQKL